MKPYLNDSNNPGVNAIVRSIFFWIIFIFLLYLSASLASSSLPPRWERFSFGICGSIVAFITAWIFLKIEKRSFADIGLVWQRATIARFLKGILIGTAIFGFILIILLGFTELRIERSTVSFKPWDAFWYLAIIPLAFMEEVAFRSYPFLKLNKVFGLRITQVILAIAFAVYHIVLGWDEKIAFLGPGIWAFVFGLAAIWSGGIAVPTGIHVAINIIQPLIGMKSGNYQSLWKLDFKEGTPADLIARADNIGLGTQVVILVVAAGLTEYYIRKGMDLAHKRSKRCRSFTGWKGS